MGIIRLIRVLHLLGIFYVSFTTSSQIHRIVFQTKSLGNEEVVQCYGKCDRNRADPRGETFNITQCNGPKIYLSCNAGYSIGISSATFGKLDPDLDVCQDKNSMQCKSNVTSFVRQLCHGQNCIVDTRLKHHTKKCGKIKFVSMVIGFTCLVTPTIKVRTRTSGINYFDNVSVTSSSDVSKDVDGVDDIEPYWILTAYNALLDSEIMRSKTANVILALLLSVVSGLAIAVVCFCVLSECTKRKKKDRIKQFRKRIIFRNASELMKYTEGNEDIASFGSKISSLNECYHTHDSTPLEELLCNQISYNNNIYSNNNENLRHDTLSKSILKEIPEDEIVDLNHNSPLVVPFEKRKQRSVCSEDNSLPISCAASSNSLEIINERHYCSYPSLTRPNSSRSSTKGNESSNRESSNKRRKNSSEDEDLLTGQYNASDEYSSSPLVTRSNSSRSLKYHRTDKYIVPSDVKYAQIEKDHTGNGDDESQFETLNRIKETKKSRLRYHGKDDILGDGIQSERSYLSCNGSRCAPRDTSRRARRHQLIRNEETFRSSSQLGVCSDNEVTRRRNLNMKSRRHDDHICREHARYVLFCSGCGKSEATDLSCSSHGSLPVTFQSHMYNGHSSINAESEYLSQDTGSDSLYSSTFSTDQEDNRMFAPAPKHSRENCHACNRRTEHFSREHCMPKVSFLSRQGMPCSHRRLEIDTRSYNSSVDDGSSRESVRLIHELNRSEMKEGCVTETNGDDKSCSFKTLV